MVYFVTTNYLKDSTIVANNVDDKILVPSIRSASDAYTRSIIGIHFYNILLTKFNNQTLNPDEIILVQEYIKPAVAWRAASEVVVASSYQITNKGTQIQSGDFSSSPEYRAIMFVNHHASDRASFYEDVLLKWMYDNRNTFPDFMSDLNKDALARKCNPTNLFDQSIILI
jgi:hypothetical protein